MYFLHCAEDRTFSEGFVVIIWSADPLHRGRALCHLVVPMTQQCPKYVYDCLQIIESWCIWSFSTLCVTECFLWDPFPVHCFFFLYMSSMQLSWLYSLNTEGHTRTDGYFFINTFFLFCRQCVFIGVGGKGLQQCPKLKYDAVYIFCQCVCLNRL